MRYTARIPDALAESTEWPTYWAMAAVNDGYRPLGAPDIQRHTVPNIGGMTYPWPEREAWLATGEVEECDCEDHQRRPS